MRIATNSFSTTRFDIAISEDRIFRNGELRYFDHPKFGVLAKITRVEESDEEVLGETELLGYDGE